MVYDYVPDFTSGEQYQLDWPAPTRSKSGGIPDVHARPQPDHDGSLILTVLGPDLRGRPSP